MKMLEIPKFGTIELIVNDGKIVATETTERKHY
ncbi:DUF2292 domain-containing protein [Streptococcus porci]|nr:DUF2292 domain-containing protein [Streptococcus porci]